jgi:hypothetical protein
VCGKGGKGGGAPRGMKQLQCWALLVMLPWAVDLGRTGHVGPKECMRNQAAACVWQITVEDTGGKLGVGADGQRECSAC